MSMMNEVEMYELIPQSDRKSFHGKAKVLINKDNERILYSYNTPIIKKLEDGTFKRIYPYVPSNTTLAHIRSFCYLNKKEFMALPIEEH